MEHFASWKKAINFLVLSEAKIIRVDKKIKA